MRVFGTVATALVVLCSLGAGASSVSASPFGLQISAGAPEFIQIGGRGDRDRDWDDRDWDEDRDWDDDRDRGDRKWRRRGRARVRCHIEWQHIWTYYGPQIVPVEVCYRRPRRRW